MSVWTTLSKTLSSVGALGSDAIERLRGAAGSGADQQRAAVTMAIVALAAKVAKADGVVTMSEAARFWAQFDVPPEGRRSINRLFELAQKDIAGFEAYAKRITTLLPEDDALREDILDILYAIAAADGMIHSHEGEMLDRVAEIFELDPVRVRRVQARHLASDRNPYALLGLSPDAPLSEVRSRYRALAKELHPDRLVGRGMPEEFIKVASERLATINEAMELIEQRSG